MLKYLLAIIIVINCFAVSNAQSKVYVDSCHVFDNLHFTYERDSIILKVTYLGVGLSPYDDVLRKMEKRHLLKAADFGYPIAFKLANCSQTYYISSSDDSSAAKSLFPPQSPKEIWIRIVVFNDFIGSIFTDKPFFIIDKVAFEPIK